ncbi:uncharacterized protein LOC120598644 isoform X2 [Pteropus medius]|uniref:uncharacterized protein LOC120598644 isoform X2 n=1 Tax=Pteropus vampyrus TaxID=132908 RepID=UPI00196BB245|nr:uncharacterized protein LOC120598644 isoform X2 [Pteropus giganteus]
MTWGTASQPPLCPLNHPTLQPVTFPRSHGNTDRTLDGPLPSIRGACALPFHLPPAGPTPQPAGTPLRRAGTLRGKSQSHQRVPTDTKPADPAPQTQVACGGHVTRGRRTHASVDASPTGERETDMSKPRLLSRSGAPCGLALRGPQGPPRSMWLGPGCRHLGSFLPGDSQGL